MSIFTLATALRYKTRDFQLHFKLAKLLEEKLFFEDIYGSEKEVIPLRIFYNIPENPVFVGKVKYAKKYFFWIFEPSCKF